MRLAILGETHLLGRAAHGPLAAGAAQGTDQVTQLGELLQLAAQVLDFLPPAVLPQPLRHVEALAIRQACDQRMRNIDGKQEE